jgi:hypothetical protein
VDGDPSPTEKVTLPWRLRAIQVTNPPCCGCKTIEETLPENTFYAKALRHRLLLRHWPADQVVQKASAWLARSEIAFDAMAAIDSVDLKQRANFERLPERHACNGSTGSRNAGHVPIEGH